MARTEGVNAVGRAIDLLRALGSSPTSLTLADLADATNLPRSTVHRIIQSLIETNFVSTDRENGGLRLGPEFARLASASGVRLAATARPYMYKLSSTIDEGVSLSVLEGQSVRFLEQIITSHGLRAFSLVGATMPAHSTANGKAMLATLPPRTLRAILPSTLDRLTEHTIVDRDQLVDELTQSRAAEVAYDREENDLGIWGVGCAFKDSAGNTAALSVAVPASRLGDRADELARLVREAAHDIERALNYEAKVVAV